ncbi:MAG: tRNA 2-selenouridine(34) synthase MnmH [Flavobacteriales bacterium]|nr:tRNA 2-selenouridine(34) synthase MnmH [Flavobacteriales bacterium]
MEYLPASQFLDQTINLNVVDVRSPSEFAAGHIPGAINIPLFADDERAIVGTIYKQKGQQPAIDKGMEFVEPKMAALADAAKAAAINGQLGVYCWRGGMRSNRTAWWFEENGVQCSVLTGGYKAFRNEALSAFAHLENLIVIDGPTGSGKTDLLHELKAAGEQILDLEGLANHKGSAFGNIGLPEQPSSQQFQNDLFAHLRALDLNKRIWIEREGMTIGKAYLPQSLWQKMNVSTVVHIDVPLEKRIQRLVNDYGNAPKEALEKSIRKLQQKLGGQHMNAALEFLENGNLHAVAELLLTYYDKRYRFSQEKYLTHEPTILELEGKNLKEDAQKLIAWANST